MTLAGSPSPDITFRFEGRDIPAVAGTSIAAALIDAGIVDFAEARDGSPRGVFCGMGTCQECLVTIDGRAGQRACMEPALAGLDVARQPAVPDTRTLQPLAAAPSAHRIETPDVLVIGAGPAGLEAARVLAASGASVLVLDEQSAPGGQFFKQAATASSKADRQMRAGRALITAATEAGAQLRGRTLVWGGARTETGLDLHALDDDGASLIQPRVLIVATGAYQQVAPVPGWTLPGVMTTGAAQTLIRRHGTAPGERVIFAGSGPLDLQVADELRRGGIAVRAIVQSGRSPLGQTLGGLALASAQPRLALQGLGLLFRLRRTPTYWQYSVRRIEGERRVERVVIGPVDARGVPCAGTEFEIPADTVCLGGRFQPNSDLARLLGCDIGDDGLTIVRDDAGATSQDDIYVIGEAGGFGGAGIARAQGVLAGHAIADRLGLGDAGPQDARASRDLARHRRFQAALAGVFGPAPVPQPVGHDDIACRCEGVTGGRLRDAIDVHGVRDVATLKRLTRAGMGRCQGRNCLATLRGLLAETGQGDTGRVAPQMPIRPVPIAALGLEKPEWGGHRRSLLPDAPMGDIDPIARPEAATVVIGGGIVGAATAYFLAKAGHDVLLLDQGRFNASASGGNAGSLHAQLLSFDFGARAEAGGTPALATLPLQRDSITLWQEIEREIGGDFEIKITGGLMIAETQAEVDFLKAKTDLERQWGIDSGVIGRDTLRALEPAITQTAIAAAWCPMEGKINPLTATHQILNAARAHGARLVDRTVVRGIVREGSGFRLETSRGPIRACKVVNAAGAYASRVGTMLGVEVPVHGAPLQMIVTEPVAPMVGRLIAHASRHLTLKQTADGTILIGGGWTAGLDPVHQHPRPFRDSIEGNLWVAAHVIPDLAKLRMVRSWAAMNINIDGAPILGEHPAVPGFFNAVTSNGYTLGPIMGRITADLVLGGDCGRNIAPFSVGRFAP